MKKFFSIQNLLRLITLAAWLIALLWWINNDPLYEQILAVVAGFGALIASFFVNDQKGGIKMKGIKAGRDVKAIDKTSQGIEAENIEAGQDVTLDES